MSLIPVFIGILLNSMYDLKFSPVGTFWALLGVLTTSVYQILVHQKQKELGLDSMQLLSYQAPMSSREYRYFRRNFSDIIPKSRDYDIFSSDAVSCVTIHWKSFCFWWSLQCPLLLRNFWFGHSINSCRIFRNGSRLFQILTEIMVLNQFKFWTKISEFYYLLDYC